MIDLIERGILMKRSKPFVYLLSFITVCSVINYIGQPRWFFIISFTSWLTSAIVIFQNTKKKIKVCIGKYKENEYNEEYFSACSAIAFGSVCAVLFLFLPISGGTFSIWNASNDSVIGRSFFSYFVSYVIGTSLFGFGLFMAVSFGGGLIATAISFIAHSFMGNQSERFSNTAFNVWSDCCALPLSLFCFISQMLGAVDYFTMFEKFLDLFSK